MASWYSIKHTNICIIGIPKGEEKEKGEESLHEKTITENFLNLEKEKNIQVHKAQRVSNKMNSKGPTPRHIEIKMAKFKDKAVILKGIRNEQLVICKENPVKLSADFSQEFLQGRRVWQNIFKALKERNIQPRILCSARQSFRVEGEIKCLSDKQN